jgi:hypothetical protein
MYLIEKLGILCNFEGAVAVPIRGVGILCNFEGAVAVPIRGVRCSIVPVRWAVDVPDREVRYSMQL